MGFPLTQLFLTQVISNLLTRNISPAIPGFLEATSQFTLSLCSWVWRQSASDPQWRGQNLRQDDICTFHCLSLTECGKTTLECLPRVKLCPWRSWEHLLVNLKRRNPSLCSILHIPNCPEFSSALQTLSRQPSTFERTPRSLPLHQPRRQCEWKLCTSENPGQAGCRPRRPLPAPAPVGSVRHREAQDCKDRAECFTFQKAQFRFSRELILAQATQPTVKVGRYVKKIPARTWIFPEGKYTF